jgi:hypothetical protein
VFVVFPVIDHLFFPKVSERFGTADGGVIGESQHTALLLTAIPFTAAADESLAEFGDFMYEGMTHDRPPI